ncbi:KICSTOR complex protein kaptin-like [Adelges cooleyi]|uniref:KICSTOR complex protein kaptin-like n=1 Tax=Adelges cooleyi TaxID=133065 RepID=UPI0021805069|nr:KICSTOR complex protein kaptin-like [Adelges cooleyi]
MSLTESSFFPMPSQGNIYSSSVITTVEGKNKILIISSMKKKIITVEPGIEDGEIEPVAKEIKFSDIPNNAEILSIHSFNKSKTSNDFTVGITYFKMAAENNHVAYLNIYSGQSGSSLEVLSQNCVTIHLNFVPYQLNHAVYSHEGFKMSWLLSGSDGRIHAYKADEPMQEQNIVNYFVEYQEAGDSSILRFDTKSYNNYQKRVSFYGCESGYSMFATVDSTKNQILYRFYEHYQSPVSVMKLFNLKNRAVNLENIVTDNFTADCDCIDEKEQVCLLVTNAAEPSIIYMNVLEDHLSKVVMLKNSNCHDVIVCSTIADTNFDSKNEILLGAYGHCILTYAYVDGDWVKRTTTVLRYPVYGLWYLDITSQGVKDLIVISERGVHILKHDPRDILAILKDRLKSKYLQ